jgi:serine protease
MRAAGSRKGGAHPSTRWIRIAVSVAVFAPIALPVDGQAIDGSSGGAPARVIVKLRSDSPLLRSQALGAGVGATDRVQALGRRVSLAMDAGPVVSERTQVVIAGGVDSATLAARLAREADVEYAVPDRRVRRLSAPNDPLYADGVGGSGPAAGQWYLRAPTGTLRSAIDAEAAWSVTTGHPGVVVAVLDTGVRFDHPDLLPVAAGGNLLPGYDMISDVPTANDGNGRDADASDPGDWLTQSEITQLGPYYACAESAEDSSWHGTQVAGIIAALTDNGRGMASVGRHVRVLPVRVLGKCGGYDSDIIAGMRWAAGLPVPGAPANPYRAQVINLSLGSGHSCGAAYRDAVTEVTGAGTVIVASAGNSIGHAVGAPANCEGVIAVAGLRHAGTKVGFSDLGPEVAIAAPGGNCVNVTPGSACLYPILTTSDLGTTTPLGPTYTDSYDASVGTSFAAPLVAGTAALMLAAQPALTPRELRIVLQATARPFPTTGGDNGDGTVVPPCQAPQYDSLGNAVDQLQCYCTTDTCGAGMLDAGAAVLGAASGIGAAGVQAEGLWWHAPAGSESGWGINIEQQGDAVFATWFTYDSAGKAWWLSMTANRTGTTPDTFAGQWIATHGPSFAAVPFDPGLVTRAVVGAGTVSFADLNRGSLTYSVNGIPQTRALTRQVFGPPPQCAYSAAPPFAGATNYQGLWWVAAGAESGWGINLTHQGDVIFATWFTYDVDGTPMWLSATATKTKTGPAIYVGPLIRTAGPPFYAMPFDPGQVTRTIVGNATLTFTSGNAATFAYTVGSVAQEKAIVRQLFAPPAGTVCR